MLARTSLVMCLLVLCLVAPVQGWAATIFGNVTSAPGGAAIASYQVLLLDQGPKGWRIVQGTLTDGSGNYTFTASEGDYIVRAVPPQATPSYCLLAQRYYDVAAPFANGTLESAADVITLATGATATGINFSIETVGAIDGRVTKAGNGFNGAQVRVLSTADERIHVDGSTATILGTAGSFEICGVDPGAYHVWIHDPNAQHEDVVAPGPYFVVSGGRANAGSLTLTTIGFDPYEPNGSTTSGSSVTAAPNPFQSTNAILTPRSSDADFYCLNALAGQRYVITSATTTIIAGQPHSSPWVDPSLGWFRASPSQLLTSNDDDPSVPGSLNARMDIVVATDGRYCVGVTSFGDPLFTGTNQVSAGRYAVRIASDELFDDGFE